MKVVHLSTTDFGGAFKATKRISESLQMQSVESTILVRTKYHDSETIEVMDSAFKKVCSKVRNGINLLFSKGDVVSDLFGADFSKIPQIADADVIFLHWVNSFVSAGSIRKLKRIGKPIIWVMHDMWVFTGGCHCDKYCGRYEYGCGECPILGSNNKHDITYNNLTQKKKLYESVDITFVAVSQWELSCAKKSMALSKSKINKISNPLDTGVFYPMNREQHRMEKINSIKKLFGKRIILFGANKAVNDKNKGFIYLVEALEFLDKEEYCAVCFGCEEPRHKQRDLSNVDIVYLGTLFDENELAIWYNVADVFVAPSLQESFCYTVCEALACGTPVAAFAVGGILDQVEHMKNGYLAEIRNSKDLARGIEYCVQNRGKLSENARRGVVCKNTYDIIGRKYLELCESAMGK